MSRGLYIAASGMLMGLDRQGRLADDLANVNTPGYKRDQYAEQSFSGVFLRVRGGGGQTERVAMGTGALLEWRGMDMRPGVLTQTGRALDLAADGEGFFVIEDAGGNQRLTRDGSFSVDGEGFIATRSGMRLLGVDGGQINVGRAAVTVAADGTIAADGQVVAQLQMATAPPDQLLRAGASSFVVEDPAQLQVMETSVVSGAVEESGVNSTQTLTQLISVARSYESAQRIFAMQNQIMGRAATDVGRV